MVARGTTGKRLRGRGLCAEIRAVGPVIVGSDGLRCHSVVCLSSMREVASDYFRLRKWVFSTSSAVRHGRRNRVCRRQHQKSVTS